MVVSPPEELAFGLVIGYYPGLMGGATVRPIENSEMVTVDDVAFQVFVPANDFGDPINIAAVGIRDDRLWEVRAESGDIVGDEAKRSLFLQVLSTFRFP